MVMTTNLLDEKLEEFTNKVNFLKTKKIDEYDLLELAVLYNNICILLVRKKDWD